MQTRWLSICLMTWQVLVMKHQCNCMELRNLAKAITSHTKLHQVKYRQLLMERQRLIQHLKVSHLLKALSKKLGMQLSLETLRMQWQNTLIGCVHTMHLQWHRIILTVYITTGTSYGKKKSR